MTPLTWNCRSTSDASERSRPPPRCPIRGPRHPGGHAGGVHAMAVLSAQLSQPVTGGHGYLYDLLRKLGLSDFGARTGEFLLVRPVKIVGIAVGAAFVARIGGRALRRGVPAVRL